MPLEEVVEAPEEGVAERQVWEEEVLQQAAEELWLELEVPMVEAWEPKMTEQVALRKAFSLLEAGLEVSCQQVEVASACEYSILSSIVSKSA